MSSPKLIVVLVGVCLAAPWLIPSTGLGGMALIAVIVGLVVACALCLVPFVRRGETD